MMNWEALSTIAEAVSAVAILVTLVYLAVQIKQAKTATLGQIVQSRASEFNVLCTTLINDGNLADVVIAVSKGEPISEADTERLNIYFGMLWNQVYAARVQYERGLITDEEFELTRGTVGFILNMWNGYGNSTFDSPMGPGLFGKEFYEWAKEIRQQLAGPN